MTHDQTVKILEKFAGSQFDPVVVRVFVALQMQKLETLESEPALECVEEVPV
jgi:HD-GYP domain-containing protein (c-di-GMP phosphodiesterase class II)